VIILFGGLLGVLLALIVVGSSAPKGKAKVRALIASDQAILQSLPPGSLAANVLDARIQATVTMYAGDLVLPSARRGAAVMSVITAGFLAGALALAWNNHSIKGDQFVSRWQRRWRPSTKSMSGRSSPSFRRSPSG